MPDRQLHARGPTPTRWEHVATNYALMWFLISWTLRAGWGIRDALVALSEPNIPAWVDVARIASWTALLVASALIVSAVLARSLPPDRDLRPVWTRYIAGFQLAAGAWVSNLVALAGAGESLGQSYITAVAGVGLSLTGWAVVATIRRRIECSKRRFDALAAEVVHG